MRKFFLAGLLAIAAALCSYNDTKADGWIAGRSQGFGWLGDKCLTCFPGIHQHGPLYNYTPMQGDYTWMQLRWSQLYNYTPAQPLNYQGQGYGGGANGYGRGRNGCGAGGCNGGAFAGQFGCGLSAAGGCGGTKWFGWFHSGAGGTWSNIFHKGNCGPAGCTSSSSCSSCTSAADAPVTGLVQTGYYGTTYPDYLSPAWR